MESLLTGSTSPPRALVVNFRRLNLSVFGAYGNEWSWTRAIDRLATRGVVFDQHLATNTDPLVAGRAWFADNADIIHLLNKSGVYTIHVHDQSAAPSPTGWVDERVAEPTSRPASLLNVRKRTYEALEKLPADVPALVWLDVDPTSPPWRPAKKWLRYYFDAGESDEDEPIEPWLGSMPRMIPPDDDPYERIQTTYAAVISSLDSGLARLLAGCRERGFGSSALTIVTASLSEPLGENAVVGRESTAIIEGVVHLPLIVRFPQNEHQGRHISALTHPGDIGELIEEFFGLVKSSPLSSRLTTDQGKLSTPRSHLLIQSPTETAVRTERHLLISPRPHSAETARLYMKPEDRWEYCDLAAKNEVIVEELMKHLT